MRDHGGNLDWAMGQWGGEPGDWVDLSTGINPEPYPVGSLSNRSWAALPTRADLQALIDAVREAYGASAEILPVAGAQAGIQMIPRLMPPADMHVIGPTYNEHAASFESAGWNVRTVNTLDDLAGATAAVVVNPNNPDGRFWAPDALRTLSDRVGLLIVDESFADPMPEVSIASDVPDNALVLRSFGKFYGLAGVRLGFVLGQADRISALSAMSGPWPVSGAAIEIGACAFTDRDWADKTIARLMDDAVWLDGLAKARGWSVLGGTTLFRLYETRDAEAAQAALAEGKVWSRIFPYSQTWLRLGMVAATDRQQVEAAFQV